MTVNTAMMSHDEIMAAGRDEIAAAMTKRRHVAGAVRVVRMKNGSVYTMTRCTNTVTGDMAKLPVGQCHVEAEYSVTRGKLTKSSVAYFCAYETAEQKAAVNRRG